MPAMSIDLSQLHLSEHGLHAHAVLKRYFMLDRGQRAHLEWLVVWHGHRVSSGRFTAQNHMASGLTLENVTKPAQSAQKFIAGHIAWQFHAASRMRSSSRCSRIRPGFMGASAKWQFTASRTMVSRSSHESPWVAINPSGRRQLAVKPPSSAGRTLKTSSRSFIP